MENEVSGIAKLGIVLIALAVLIGLGFGIFQISKGTANSGVNDVQKELDNVSKSTYSSYDQTIITGTSLKSAMSSFSGSPVAILISTQSWINLQAKVNQSTKTTANKAANDAGTEGSSLRSKGAGFSEAYETNTIPIVTGYGLNTSTGEIDQNVVGKQNASNKSVTQESWINYNAILGNKDAEAPGVATVKSFPAVFNSYTLDSGNKIYMAAIYFDTNCYRCSSGFAVDNNGQTIYNNITGNLDKTGKTEYVPNGAKFQCYLIKDLSGTTMGFTATQTTI